LVQIKKQIKALEQEAEAVRAKEVAGVIERVKAAIEFYALTPDDLFGVAGPVAPSKSARSQKAIGKTASKPKAKTPTPAKYRNQETGKTWTGHGKRPAWFVNAIANGATAESLAI
jgi:DNA-binding protein H-NS